MNIFQDELKDKFRQELTSWIGTPYKHLNCEKGYGADCVLFLAGCLQEIGLLSNFDYSYYPKDWWRNGTKEILLEGFERNIGQYADKVKITYLDDLEQAQFGDFLGFSFSRKTGLTNHCAVLLCPGEIIHSVEKLGVVETQLSINWEKRLTKIVRLEWV